ncbi:hypothetical protein GR925_13945 [Streptomyces sp. HUCO-GS316]|uniref:hypothetical protein n=1 Tax=Streptomyces sp. HUCO-GS316 TaxID=2692198 RepID=UPI00136E1FFE|nr:hypothetical protein [Streptomyces sp. HUCO-GS316]MXM64518.1 hypothetical protein [Streptomyces sp. HUCO-GS316]
MTPLRWVLVLSGWAALAAATFLPDAGVLRVLVTTAFLLVCPGLAASRWARSAPAYARDRTAVLETGLLAVVISLSLAVIVAETLYLSDAFTVTRALLALAVVTSVLALVPGRRSRRRPVPDTGSPTAAADQPEPRASD